MLTGKELGTAIREAIRLKGVTQKDVAIHFGITQPSVHDWVTKGTVGKDKLDALFTYFSNVVGPEHWGTTRPITTATHTAKQDRATYHLKPRHTRALVQELIDIADRLDDAGLNRLIGMATTLIESHPRTRAKPKSSA